MQEKRTKLLMGIPHPKARGGPPTHIPMLVDYFREHPGYNVRTFYYGSKLFGTERGQQETIIEKIFVTVGKLIEYLYLLGTFRPHIVHISTAFTKLAIMRDLPFAVFSKMLGKKSIFKLHGSHLDLIHTENRIQIYVIKLLFWGTTKIGVLSNAEKHEIIQSFGYAEKLVLTKNIVAFDDPAGPADLSEKTWHGAHGLFVSRVEKLKGLQDLIRAMVPIRQAIPNFKLIVAGDGPDMENCTKLADRLNLTESITWLGYVDNRDVQSLYRQCDVFVFSTHYPEGMPMVLVEALRSGIPIVTTKVWFSLNYLEDRKNCLFVEKGSPDDLSEKIVSILNDQSLQTIIQRENPRLVEKFRKATVGREFEEIYRDMLAGRPESV